MIRIGVFIEYCRDTTPGRNICDFLLIVDKSFGINNVNVTSIVPK